MTVPQNRKLNNKGMSVVELMIIIAIIAVLMSGMAVSFTILNSSNIKQATRTCKSYMEKTRTSTMSVMADEWYFELKNSGGDYVAAVYKVVTDSEGNTTTSTIEEENIGSKVSISLLSGDDTIALSADDVLKVKFDTSSGSVSSVSVNGVKYTPADNMVTLYYQIGAKENWVDLYFVSGNIEVR